MKILFVHLGREHLGLEYLSALLKQAGHDTELACDIGFFGINDNIIINKRLERFFDRSADVLRKFVEYKPDMVCMSAYTTTLKWCFRMAEEMKAIADTTIALGGIHVTLVPEKAIESPAIDYGFHGEAESVIVEFANRLAEGLSVDNLPGVISRSGDGARINPLAKLVQDLDSLPFPDKELFEHAINIRDDYMTLTTRGCVFNCAYCCEHSIRRMYQDEIFRRVRGVASLIEELETMNSRYGFREVYFACPLFPPDKNWVSNFADEYRAKIGKPFYCFGHVNFFDHEYAKLLKEAGCRSIEFGVQTMNEEIRRRTLGRTETNERLVETLSICDLTGLNFDVDVIFQLPGEREDDFRSAVETFSSFRMLHRVKVFNLALFPGTDLLEHTLEEGLLDECAYREIESGGGGDFFHSRQLEGAMETWKQKAYENTLRILPLLPQLCKSIAHSNFALRLMALPPPSIVKLLEFINLARMRDLRLAFYIRLYARHLLVRVLRTRL